MYLATREKVCVKERDREAIIVFMCVCVGERESERRRKMENNGVREVAS